MDQNDSVFSQGDTGEISGHDGIVSLRFGNTHTENSYVPGKAGFGFGWLAA